MNRSRIAATTAPRDLARGRQWTDAWFADPEALPVSFALDGRPHRGLAAAWQPRVTRRRVDACIDAVVFVAADPASGLQVRVEVTRYRDFPVVEWVAWFQQTGAGPSPLLSQVQALDATLAGGEALLWCCNGDFCSETGYAPERRPLAPGVVAAFAPTGGRPCDGAFPYFRLCFPDGGLCLAVGWPGQWAVRFEGLAAGVAVAAGQECLRVQLQSGERVRTPRMTLLAWDGDERRGVNLWRRWMRAHVLPRPDGTPLAPRLALSGTDEGEEFTAADEANQRCYLDKARALGLDFDTWWIDAGWYPCADADGQRHWPLTGSWFPDPERFPRGLRPVSQAAARHGAELLVWFEPERVRPGTWLDREHPEWLLHAEGSVDGLLDLGNPEARRWLTEHVCRLIAEAGIGVYRQDHNFPPLTHWRQGEAEDRQGLRENLHVEGYLRYWDDLLARNPGLWIDSCASGGRRNDLETLRRSVPLHYSDYGYGDHPVKLAFHRTLHEWIPYFKEATLSWDQEGRSRFDAVVDPFGFHCGLAPMLFATLDLRRDDYDWALARRLVELWRRAAPFLLHGDFYPLTPFHRDPTRWVAWQFDDPEGGAGMVQAIRLAQAQAASFTAPLQALDPEATYRLEDPERGQLRRLAGRELLETGLPVKLPARAGVVWFYRREADPDPQAA